MRTTFTSADLDHLQMALAEAGYPLADVLVPSDGNVHGGFVAAGVPDAVMKKAEQVCGLLRE